MLSTQRNSVNRKKVEGSRFSVNRKIASKDQARTMRMASMDKEFIIFGLCLFLLWLVLAALIRCGSALLLADQKLTAQDKGPVLH